MMRTIKSTEITKTIADLCLKANIEADDKMVVALKKAYKRESSAPAKVALEMILENMECAKADRMPMCQDTGMVIVMADVGQDVHIEGNLTDAINEGVREGYRDGYFRASVVNDPHYRLNTSDNTPAVIHFNIVDGDKITLTVMPKGFGSENKSAVKMLTPSDGVVGIEDFVVETIRSAGVNPCPPIIVGVGLGGTMEKAALLSKLALNEMFEDNADEFWAKEEKRLLTRINNLRIGAAGFKGNNTALGVRILTHPTHIAGLPVAVTIGCHVSRHKTAVI